MYFIVQNTRKRKFFSIRGLIGKVIKWFGTQLQYKKYNHKRTTDNNGGIGDFLFW